MCCRESSRSEYIQCFYCKGQTHSLCNDLSKSDLKSWKSVRFVCRSCAYDGDSYAVNAALVR
jgi:hypothetical protein